MLQNMNMNREENDWGQKKGLFLSILFKENKAKKRKTDKNYLSSPRLINILDEQLRTNVKVMTVSQ